MRRIPMLLQPYARKFDAVVLTFVILIFGILGSAQAYAQVAGASITGTVKDSSARSSPMRRSPSQTSLLASSATSPPTPPASIQLPTFCLEPMKSALRQLVLARLYKRA